MESRLLSALRRWSDSSSPVEGLILALLRKRKTKHESGMPTQNSKNTTHAKRTMRECAGGVTREGGIVEDRVRANQGKRPEKSDQRSSRPGQNALFSTTSERPAQSGVARDSLANSAFWAAHSSCEPLARSGKSVSSSIRSFPRFALARHLRLTCSFTVHALVHPQPPLSRVQHDARKRGEDQRRNARQHEAQAHQVRLEEAAIPHRSHHHSRHRNAHENINNLSCKVVSTAQPVGTNANASKLLALATFVRRHGRREREVQRDRHRADDPVVLQ